MNDSTGGDIPFDTTILRDLVTWTMPFGQYQNCRLCDVPEHYLAWFNRTGFPAGRLGVLMATAYEIKINGLEYLLKPLKEAAGNR